MSELTLYTNPMSRGRIARWMLEEIGQPYDTEVLDYGTTMKSSAYLAVNPMGKVPTLCHRDVVVTEYGAICAYLGDAFPGAGLAPDPTSPERGAYYRWLFFACGPLDQAMANAALGWRSDDPKARGRLGYGCVQDTLDAIDGWLATHDYVTGCFSAADVALGSGLAFALQSNSFEPRPRITAYVERLMARPAAIRTNAIDDALLAGTAP